MIQTIAIYLAITGAVLYAVDWMITIGAENWPEMFEWLDEDEEK